MLKQLLRLSCPFVLCLGLMPAGCDDGDIDSSQTVDTTASTDQTNTSAQSNSRRTTAQADDGRELSEHPDFFTPRQPHAMHEVSGGAGLHFEVLDYDFGPMTNAETRSVEFPFINNGDEALRIEGLKAACGCTRPSIDKYEYAPGERGTVHVDYTPRTGGWQAKSMSVLSNASQPGEIVKIRVISDVEAVLTFSPRQYDLGEIPLGETHRDSFTITADAPNTWFDSLATRRSKNLQASFSQQPPVKDEATIDVVISDDAPWGYFRNGAIEVQTRGKLEDGREITKDLWVRITAKVIDEIRASEYSIRVGRVPYGNEFRGEVLVSHVDGEPFEVINPVVEPMDASMRGVAQGTYNIKTVPNDGPKGGHTFILTGTAGNSHGFLSGTVRFRTRTEDGKETERTLGINGRVIDPNNPPPPIGSR